MPLVQNLHKFIYLLFGLIILISCNSKLEEVYKRKKNNINNNWLYLENNTKDVNDAIKDNSWVEINLPHSWNSLDATDLEPGYRRSASWYKKTLEVPLVNSESMYSLYFEGVNIVSEVFLNGKKVGGHIGGYIGFDVDITKAIKSGINEVLVRVDNGYNPEIIPSQKSDFFIFGGITRDVWLQEVPRKHLSNLKITTPEVSVKNATLKATVNINNSNSSSKEKIKATLIDSEGNIIEEGIFETNNSKFEINFSSIKNPKLWDVKSPYLYTLKLFLLNNNKVVDEIKERLGFRWFEFKENGPFYLNGERLLLRGTHRHEEHAGVGAAMTNKQHRKDMESIKEMGANFVRLAHYPQDPEVYKACDELGILVWDEIPWCRGGVGNDVWKTNTKNQLKEMISQNFNHPSIIIWSLGNEMYWLPDFEGGDNTEKMNAFLTELNDISHELDPSRKTAIRKYYDGANIVDVFSPSIWSGWYSGSYKSYKKAVDTYKKEYKHFLHAEYGGSSHVGRHTENPITGEGQIKPDGWEEAVIQTKVKNIAKIGDWSENYIVDLFDWHLRISELDSTFVGNIQWAFKDFGTPLRPENAIPYMNQKGLVDRNGIPKDAYYVFKSYWSDVPFTYIESSTWTERQGPKNKPRTISVYSNCDVVSFYHNDQFLGDKKRDISKFPASGLTWDVKFKKGKNKLVAIGKTSSGAKVENVLNVNYRFTKNGVAKKLKLSSKKLENGNYLVTAIAFDKNDLRCLDYEKKIYFQCLQGGELLKNQGTPTGSQIIEMANGKASIEVIPNKSNNPIKVVVLNQSFKGTYLTIKN
ncbi:glycoside hydrolase family 2 TIM barrel-domain containing protein [uncultured Polaribacter sp.]|uniref:glycoside hydrolase family 2 protein n=1 Tax=uncultured Polaribacter sp. TaxID=174711 RepID=UPI0026038ED2|nr:glycoside hydrolase family 2 TIM barrel-domain containing protein [uncultured Polaribacter sp.]